MNATAPGSSGVLRLTKLLGSGNERLCWEHPEDSSRCVKTVKADVVGRRQNEIDSDYYRLLCARGISDPRIPSVFGWVETDRGRGLVVERIIDANAGEAMSLAGALKSGRLSAVQVRNLIDETFEWCLAHNVVVSDCNPEHLMLRQDAAGRDILAVVDGLGGFYLDFRYHLRNKFPWYARRKSKKTWRQLQEMVFANK